MTDVDFITVAVGEASPFPALPADETAVMMTLRHPVPVVVISVPDVSEDDIDAVEAPVHLIGLVQTNEIPCGGLVLLMRVSDTQEWPICVPFIDHEPIMRNWAAAGFDLNALLLVLVDARNGVVCAHRVIDLPPRLLDMVRSGIRLTPLIDTRAPAALLGSMDHSAILAQATRWMDVDGSGQFTLVGTSAHVT